MNVSTKPLLNSDIPSQVEDLITEELVNYLIIKDGHIIAKQIDESHAVVQIELVTDAIMNHKEFYAIKELNKTEDEALQYNFENVNSGLLIHVPKKTILKKPLHIFYVQEQDDLINNVTIVVDEESEFDYFEYLVNVGAGAINHASTAFVKDNAKLQYAGLSKFDGKAIVSVRRNAYVYRYGKAEYSVAEVNDATTESNTNIYLEEQYASGVTKTVAITSGSQEASFTQLVEHNAKETEGFIENYGVSNHQSMLTFEGVGKINKDMKHSIARQSNRGIVLGELARLDANPLLLIDEFDVEASHGAAIGKIDEEQLYYLMSRGLPLRMAERLIISGFLSPVIERLSTDKLIEDFVMSVENKTL